MAAATPPEVRKARAFLRTHGINSKEIPPKKLANSAKELDRGFREVIRTIMRLRGGGQNRQAERAENISQALRKE